MIEIVFTCCILHKFLMGMDVDETLILEVNYELLQNEIDISQTQ